MRVLFCGGKLFKEKLVLHKLWIRRDKEIFWENLLPFCKRL